MTTLNTYTYTNADGSPMIDTRGNEQRMAAVRTRTGKETHLSWADQNSKVNYYTTLTQCNQRSVRVTFVNAEVTCMACAGTVEHLKRINDKLFGRVAVVVSAPAVRDDALLGC